MRFKFRQISAVLASVVMIGSSAGIAAAASYPAPFVAGGTADVAIVYGTGTGVSALDVVEAGNVQADLQSRMTGATSSTTSVSSGEGTKIEQSSNRLNLGNGVSDVWGTQLTKTNMPLVLADSKFYNKQNSEYSYTQTITLANITLRHFADSDYNNYKPTIGFWLTANSAVSNYTLDFVTDPEATMGTDLTDFEGKNIQVLGRDYYILDFKNSTAKLTLLDSAVTTSLNEGESKEVSLAGASHTVKISFITSDQVILNIDGTDTEKLSATGTTYGNTYPIKAADGTLYYIGIKSINVQDYAGGIKSVDFSLGKGKLEITDSANVKINDKSLTDLYGYITLSNTGTKRTWQKLVIEWRVNDEAFLTPEKELLMPGFEAVKFTMADTTIPEKELTTVEYSGSDVLNIKTTIKDGDITLPILYMSTTTGNISGIGKSATDLLFTSNDTRVQYNATSNSAQQYNGFIVSWADARNAESYWLKATVRYDADGVRNLTTINNKVTGQDVCTDLKAADTCTLGNVILTVQSVNYTAGTDRLVAMSVNSGGSFNRLYTKNKLKIFLPFSALDASAAAANSTDYGHLITATADSAQLTADARGNKIRNWGLWMSEANKDGTLDQNKFQMNITPSGTTSYKITVNTVSGSTASCGSTTTPGGACETEQSSKVWEQYLVSDLATKITWDKSYSDQYDAVVEYHGGEVYGNLYVAEPSAVVSGGGSTTSTVTQLGTVVFKDSEVDSVKTKNIIAVGGSCINSVAAKVLGDSYCGAAFTTATKVGTGQFLIKSAADTYTTGKIVLVVAGYEAADTQNAAKYLRTKTVDTTAGKTYIGTSATEASLQVA